MQPQTEGEAAFASFKGEADRNQPPKTARAAWIPKEAWQMADWRKELQRVGRERTRDVCKARCDFQCALQADRRKRVQSTGTRIEGFLEAGRVKEAWEHLAQCDRQVQGKHAYTNRKVLEQE